MGMWGWIVLYVLLFSVLQLLIYRYLRGDEETSFLRSTPTGAETVSLEDPARDEQSESSDSSVRVCHRCGAENEAGYTYCRSCANPITSR